MSHMTEPTPSPRPLDYAGPGYGRGSRLGRRIVWAVLILVVLLVLVFSLKDRGGRDYTTIPLSNFYQEMNDGHVQRLQVEGNEVFGTLASAQIINGRKVSEFRAILPSGTT